MNDSMTTGTRVVNIARRRWYAVLAAMLAVCGITLAYTTVVAKPVYEARSQVTFSPPERDTNPTGSVLPSSGVTRENMQTLAGFARSGTVLADASKKAGLDSAEDLIRATSVTPNGESASIEIVAKSGDAEKAANIANAYANTFVEDRRQRLQKVIDKKIELKNKEINDFPKMKADDPRVQFRLQAGKELSELLQARQSWSDSINVSIEAATPEFPIWPRKKLSLLAAIIVGFTVGVGFALVLEKLDRKVSGEEWSDLPLPVLVRVPKSSHAKSNSPLGPGSAEPIVADAFAALGARVMLDHSSDSGALVLLVTSSRSSEGKSSVAANLSYALAQGGRRVVLIDADMRRPTQSILFPSLNGRPGLSQVLSGQVPVEHALALVAQNLAAVPSGPKHQNASVLLASVAFKSLVERLTDICDVVIIDAPPVLAVNDALAISAVANHVIVCARIDLSDENEVRTTSNRIASSTSAEQSMVLVGTDAPIGYGYEAALNLEVERGNPFFRRDSTAEIDTQAQAAATTPPWMAAQGGESKSA